MRHPADRAWNDDRRELTPTLDDLVLRQVGLAPAQSTKARVRACASCSGSTRIPAAWLSSLAPWMPSAGLGWYFRRHQVMRRYLAVVAGSVQSRTIKSRIWSPDRGDGRRGSTSSRRSARKRSRTLPLNSNCPATRVLSCRLETGRTHQIRHPPRRAGPSRLRRQGLSSPRPGDQLPDESGARAWPCTPSNSASSTPLTADDEPGHAAAAGFARMACEFECAVKIGFAAALALRGQG